MSKTLTRAEISEQLSTKIGLSRYKANEILEDIIKEMIHGLAERWLPKVIVIRQFCCTSKK